MVTSNEDDAIRVPTTLKRRSIWKRMHLFFFAEDIFISYARKDAATYAARLGAELTGKGAACYLDQFEPTPGIEIPAVVQRALFRSNMLLVLATRAANTSRSMELEIDVFRTRERQIQVIELHATLDSAPWRHKVVGVPPLEDLEGGRSNHPSTEVIQEQRPSTPPGSNSSSAT